MPRLWGRPYCERIHKCGFWDVMVDAQAAFGNSKLWSSHTAAPQNTVRWYCRPARARDTLPVNPCPNAANHVRADPSPSSSRCSPKPPRSSASAPSTTNGAITAWRSGPTSSAAPSSSASGDASEPRDAAASTAIPIRAPPSTHSPPSSAAGGAGGIRTAPGDQVARLQALRHARVGTFGPEPRCFIYGISV
jgi:hypothetical protein